MFMGFAQPSNPSGSSQPFISGYPIAAEHAEAFANEFNFFFDDAIDVALDHARKEIREAARRSESWRAYADKIDIQFDGTEFEYVLTGTEEENAEMLALEYGDEERRPESLLRHVALNEEWQMGKLMTDLFSSEVPIA